jgi:DNA-binding CsgD family transcriptional regulator
MNSFATAVWESEDFQSLRSLLSSEQSKLHDGRFLKVDCKSGRPPYLAWVTSLSEGVGGAHYEVMTIYDPERSPDLAKDSLLAAYRFTKAEMRLIDQLLQGRTPAEAAEELGVTIHTVRTYLKRLYQKTGVRSQATLVRRLFQITMSSVPPEVMVAQNAR